MFVDQTYSVDDAVNRAGYGKFQIILLVLAGIGWVCYPTQINKKKHGPTPNFWWRVTVYGRVYSLSERLSTKILLIIKIEGGEESNCGAAICWLYIEPSSVSPTFSGS